MFKVGESIRKIRLDRSLSQYELAHLSGLTASYLSLLENGRRSPSLSALTNLSDAMDVPIEVLIWDSVEIPPNLSSNDQRICETAKMIVRRFFEVKDAPSAT